MNDIIRPFYIYRFKLSLNTNSCQDCIHVIAYDIDDCRGELHWINSGTPLISNPIRSVYHSGFSSTSYLSHSLIEVTKLGFEDLAEINNAYSKLDNYCEPQITHLLELMLVNWDDWN